MPTRVFLLRHAESADPTVFHGAESDVELSARGFLQAEAVAAFLAKRRPERLIASAMRRARLTAEAIARTCGLEVLVEPELHERRVGSLCGAAFDSHDGIWAETVRRWSSGETSFTHEGAESFDDIQKRVLPVWQRVLRQYEGQALAVVAHGVVCKVLLLSILPGWSVRDWQRLGSVRNVAVSELVHDGTSWMALSLNQPPPEIEQDSAVNATTGGRNAG